MSTDNINNDNRRIARSDYIYKNKTQSMIALKLDISASTVRRWKKEAKAFGDDWDMARTACMIAGEGLDAVIVNVLEEFMILAQGMIEEIKDAAQPLDKRVKQLTSLADAMMKATNSAGKLAPKISELGVAQDVLRRLLDYVREEYPQHAAALLEIIEPFGEKIVEAYK